MHPDYKIYVRYDKATSVAELQARASEFEEIEWQRRGVRQNDRTDIPKASATAAYSKKECC